jgi:hypothetical protein
MMCGHTLVHAGETTSVVTKSTLHRGLLTHAGQMLLRPPTGIMCPAREGIT